MLDNHLKPYKEGTWKAPSPDTDVKRKNKDFYLQAAQAFISTYLRGLTSIAHQAVPRLRELRRYGVGQQSPTKYKEWYTTQKKETAPAEVQEWTDGGTMTKEELREGWGNMDFEHIVSIAPKINLSLHGMLDDVDWVVSATSTDPRSGKERDKIKWGTWLEKEYGNLLDEMRALGGVPSDKPQFIPKTLTEQQLYEANGGYKIPYEMAIEKACEHSFEVSNWDEVKAECIDDIRDWNMMGVRTYVCERSGKILARHVDLTRFIIQYSKHYDHHDATRAAEIIDVTVGSLRPYFPVEDDLKNIAKSASSYLNNPALDKFDEYNQDDGFGQWKYDHYIVPVFDMVFQDYDNHFESLYTPKIGYTKIRRAVAPDYIPKEREEVKKITIHNLKKVKWIIGTDYCYDYGIDNDMMRPNMKDVILPYIFIKFPGKSITDSLIPHYDDIMHIHLRTQNALTTAAHAGFAVDMDLLQNMAMSDGTKLSELDIFDIYRHKGILFFKRQDAYGQPNGGGVPIQELPGGIGRLLEELMSMLQHTLTMIETITGINPTVLGSTPDEKMPVRATQMAVRGTDNVMRPLIRGLRNSKKRTAERFCLSIPQLVKHYSQSKSAYESAIGRYDVELLKMISDDIHTMGIKLEPKLTQSHQENLLRIVELAMQKDTNGQAGLGIGEAMLIQERILGGTNLKLVRMEITSMIRDAEERMQAQREHLIRVQGEETRALEGQKHQQVLQHVDVQTSADMALKDKDLENKIKFMMAQSDNQILTDSLYEDAETTQTPSEGSPA